MSAPSAESDSPAEGEAGPGGRRPALGRRRAAQLLVVAGAAVLTLFTAGVVGHAAGTHPAPAGDSAAAGFARDMIDHHAQAVDMATILHDRTQDAELRYLTTDIALTQTSQMGEMRGWLDAWHLPLGRVGAPMAWMTTGDGGGMDMSKGGGGMNMSPAGGGGQQDGTAMDPALMRLGPDGLMPGMATTAQINQLRTLPPPKADVMFLQLMIRHHKAGVAMAQTALALTGNAEVDVLARSIVASQQSEIVQMTQMLHQRGATP